MKKVNGVTPRKRSWVIPTIVVILATIATSTIIDASLPTVKITPDPSSIQAQANIAVGYMNMTSLGAHFTGKYILGGYFHNTVNQSNIQLDMTVPFTFTWYLVNESLSSPVNSVSIGVDSFTVAATGNLPLGPLTYQSTTSGFTYGAEYWGFNSSILSHPGIHHLFLNFTLTPYSDITLYKVPGNQQQVTIEWNVTVA